MQMKDFLKIVIVGTNGRQSGKDPDHGKNISAPLSRVTEREGNTDSKITKTICPKSYDLQKLVIGKTCITVRSCTGGLWVEGKVS